MKKRLKLLREELGEGGDFVVPLSDFAKKKGTARHLGGCQECMGKLINLVKGLIYLPESLWLDQTKTDD